MERRTRAIETIAPLFFPSLADCEKREKEARGERGTKEGAKGPEGSVQYAPQVSLRETRTGGIPYNCFYLISSGNTR